MVPDIAQCEAVRTSGAKVILICPINSGYPAFLLEVNKLHYQGLQNIVYDRLLMGSDPNWYVAFDSYLIGQMQGQYLKDHVSPGANYAILKGDSGDNNATLVDATNLDTTVIGSSYCSRLEVYGY